MSRRAAVRSGVVAAVGGAVVASTPTLAHAEATILEQGADLTGWDLAVGDGLWVPPSGTPIDGNDIELLHLGDRSQVVANRTERSAMVHAIGFYRHVGAPELTTLHRVEVDVRVPSIPQPIAPLSPSVPNAQTLEVGLFVWDGAGSRLDTGLALQWVLNPWVPDQGALRVWANGPDGPHWVETGHLAVDDAWHRVALDLDPSAGHADLFVDGVAIASAVSHTPKDASWGTEVAARFQIEAISVWPGTFPTAPRHPVEARNWAWRRQQGVGA